MRKDSGFRVQVSGASRPRSSSSSSSSIFPPSSSIRGRGRAGSLASGLLALVVPLLAFGQDVTNLPSPIKVGEEVVIAAAGLGGQSRDSGAVAYGADVFLAVWHEGAVVKGVKSKVFATRVSRDGKLLDKQPIALGDGNGGQQDRPKVSFCPSTGSGGAGGSFLVVWQEFNGKDMDVLGARVSPAGRVLDVKAIQIAAGPHTQVLPEVAANDKASLVVWQGFDGKDLNCRIYWAMVDPSGTVGQAGRWDGWPTANPKVAWNEGEFLVAGVPSFHAFRVDAEGKAVKGSGARVCYNGAIASMSGLPGVGWVHVSNRANPDYWGWGGPGAMRAYTVRQGGKWDEPPPAETGYPQLGVIEPQWLDVAYGKDMNSTWPNGQSAVAWDGTRCVAVWTRFRTTANMQMVKGDLMAGRLEGWRPVDQKRPIVVAVSEAEEINPALASDGNGKLLCVYERKGADGNVQICARTLESVPMAPVFTVKPGDVSGVIGQTATFRVGVEATPAAAFQWQKDGQDIPGATAATYTTPVLTKEDDGHKYRVTAKNALGSVTSDEMTLSVSEGVLMETWSGVNSISNLTGNANYPDKPTSNRRLTMTEGPALGANYGSRMRGLLNPPVTGDYTFWVAADDVGELWLSTDETPGKRVKIAWTSGWTEARAWEKKPSQKSAAVKLEAGKKYYFEVLHIQGGGGENIAIGWQLPDGKMERPVPASRVTGP